MPSIFNQPNGAPVIDYNNSIVEIAEPDDWGDWQMVPYLICHYHEDALPPTTGKATFNYRTGFLKVEDQNDPDQFDPLDLTDYYVRVSMQQPDSDPVPVWWGIFTEQTTTSIQTDIPSGDQEFTAHGIYYILDRNPITGSKAYKPNPVPNGDPPNVTVSLNSVMSHNRKPTKGKALVGNRSKNLGPDGVYLFSGAAKKWTNLDIAQYLLQYWVDPTIPFSIVGQTDALNSTIGYHDFKEGTTVWKALCELVSRKKGLIMIPQVVDDQVYIVIDSTQDTPTQVAGMTIPGNSNLVDFTMPPDAPFDQLVDDIPITETNATNYGNIFVYGARVKMMFPAVFASLASQVPVHGGNLLHGGAYYTTQYLTGVPGGMGNADTNDRERQKDIYRDVFQSFKIDHHWDGKMIPPSSSNPANVVAIPYPDGTIDIVPPPDAQPALQTDVPGAQFVWFDKVYYKKLPIKHGVDYTQTPPVDNNPNPGTAEYIPLLGLYYDQANGTLHTADQKWHKLENLKKDNGSLKALTVHPMDTELGVHIEGHPNHYLALNHWAGANPTNHEPELDYENLCIVGCIDLDVRPCCQWQAPDGNDRIKTEVMPSCRFMYAVPNCPIDVDNNGQLVTMPDDNVILDDDHKVLQQVCAEMVAWYGTPRQTVTLTIKQPGVYVSLGAFLEQINTNYSTEPIGTLITTIRTDYDKQTTTITTGFEELDYKHLLGRPEDTDAEEVAE